MGTYRHISMYVIKLERGAGGQLGWVVGGRTTTVRRAIMAVDEEGNDGLTTTTDGDVCVYV